MTWFQRSEKSGSSKMQATHIEHVDLDFGRIFFNWQLLFRLSGTRQCGHQTLLFQAHAIQCVCVCDDYTYTNNWIERCRQCGWLNGIRARITHTHLHITLRTENREEEEAEKKFMSKLAEKISKIWLSHSHYVWYNDASCGQFMFHCTHGKHNKHSKFNHFIIHSNWNHLTDHLNQYASCPNTEHYTHRRRIEMKPKTKPKESENE